MTGVRFPANEGSQDPLLKSPRLLLSEYRYLFTRGTAAGRETNYSVTSELRMVGIILPVSHISPQPSP